MSAHFTLPEFLNSDTADDLGINNYPSWEEVENLKRLAETMEQVRTFLGNKAVTVLSGFRCADVNKAVGGAISSAHLYGLACDFIVPDFGDPLAVCKALEPHLGTLAVDQLIYEFTDWVHLGLTTGTPRHQCLTIDNSGTFNGFK
jgi:hypothetical protein